MKRNVQQLQGTTFDVAVIGGGITGACLAHDSAMRGLKTALIDKHDFGMSTSAASSKLLHGGIRYLQKLQFGKVRESARERTYFQVIAPHLTTQVNFLIPTIRGSLMQGKGALLAGMNFYSLLCTGLNRLIDDPAKRISSGRYYSRRQVLDMVPMLETIHGLSGAHTLTEVHMDNSERMTLAFIKSAVANGATAANHVEAVRLRTAEKQVVGIGCRDVLTGSEFDIDARIVINAAGPFLPALNSQIEELSLWRRTTGFSKGVHLVTRQLEGTFALALSSGKKTEGLVTRGGRHIFMIPWRGHTLIGTTNVPFNEDLEKVRVTKRDVDEFIQDINAILPGLALSEKDVRYAFAGLYPLISEEVKADTYQGTGEYQVVDHQERDGIDGIVSVLGAKYTTARAVAEQAIDIVAGKLGVTALCRTMTTPLLEGNTGNLETFISAKQARYSADLTPETVRALVVSHGSEVDRVIDYLKSRPGYLERLSDHRETLAGEVAYSVEHEMACTLDDIVFARTGLGTIGHPGSPVIDRVCQLVCQLLGWDDATCRKEIKTLERRYSWPDT